MNIQLIASPIIGAAIGYITNDIAIKMLFHPRKAVYIGKLHVPMTPGLIPKEKSRIAASLGKAVSEQLLNSEVLEEALLSGPMLDKLSSGLDRIIDKNKNNEKTVNELLHNFMSENDISSAKESISRGITGAIVKMIKEEQVGYQAAGVLMDYAREQIQGTFLAMFSSMLDEGMQARIAGLIDDLLENNSEKFIREYTDKGIENISQKKVCDLINKHEDGTKRLKEFIIEAYRNIIGKNLKKILNMINLEKIVRERIDGFDVAELEALIFGIMKKELNMIVYLGAVLGFIMGCMNAALSLIR